MARARAASLLLGTACFASAAFALAGAAGAAPGAQARVVSVERGETLVVRMADGRTRRVFLVGVRAPDRGECHGAAAVAATRRLGLGRTVRLTSDPDPAHSGLMSGGTLVVYLTLPDGRDLGRALIAGGHAVVGQRYPPAPPRYPPPRFARQSVYEVAERRARAARRGLWRACSADASVALGASPDRVAVGEEITYTAVVRNVGRKPTGYFQLAFDLPDTTSAIEAPGRCLRSLRDTYVECSRDTLRPRANWVVTIRATPAGAGAFRATAEVRALRLDADRRNDRAAVVTIVTVRR